MAEHVVERPVVTDTPKKRIRHERKEESMKKMKLSNHQRGEDCKCRMKCFDKLTDEEMDSLIEHFNSLSTKNEQDSYLSVFVLVKPVARRRPRQDKEKAALHDYSYEYNVKFVREGKAFDEIVCFKAFIALFGITNRRVQTIKAALTKTGCPPIDKRGKHANRLHKLSPDVEEAIIQHISSFRGRTSHYSLGTTRKVYLPEELNISKMFQMFLSSHPADTVASYQTYRKLFNEKFNIGFRYPRKDTCSMCDELHKKIELFEVQENPSSAKNLRDLVVEKELHQRKAQTFYKRKSDAKDRARTDTSVEALVFDFQKNLNAPNKTANDIYYKRQLTCISFNVHVLSSDCGYFYMYNETVAKKGADDMSSMLHHFFFNFLDSSITDLEVFCDGCAGQNKNYTLIRFCHWLVHKERKFNTITVRFSIRGHSYLECDRDMALVKQTSDIDLPNEWHHVFRDARAKPSPFTVIPCERELFKNFSSHLKPMYKNSCPFKTRPIREFMISVDQPQLVSFRDSWNGHIETAVIVQREISSCIPPLQCSYEAPIPIKQEKYKDLQFLKRLCKPSSQDFYTNLPVVGRSHDDDSSDSEYYD